MHILFLTQVLPYPIDAGPKVRGYYNLCYLANNHKITLVSFVRSSDTNEALSHMESLCARMEILNMPRSRWRDGTAIIKSLLSRRPVLVTRDEIHEMDRLLCKLVQEDFYDAIHADQLWMAPYALKAREAAIRYVYCPKIILDQHNAVHLIPKRMAEGTHNKFLRWWLRREARLLAVFEVDTCHQFDRIVWVTKEDQKAISSISDMNGQKNKKGEGNLAITNKSIVIPICIEAPANAPTDKQPTTKDILFVGGMHWPPNAEGATWFGKEVFPQIAAQQSMAKYIAVGRQPPREIQTLGQQVITPGYVDNIDRYWTNARVFVVPLRSGGGMRVKILDAWAKGIPIVSTTIGAEGITYQDGTDILIADTVDEFAFAVLRILTDDNLAMRLSHSGRITLEKLYNWKKIYPAWDYIYNLS